MRTVRYLAAFAFAVATVSAAPTSEAQQPPSLARCLPVSERTGPVGCWIIAHEPLGEISATTVFWQLTTYADRPSAESAKVAGATVVEALGEWWLFTIGPQGTSTAGGKRVAEIGPLAVKTGTNYTAQYMEAIFPPGAQTRPHTHPGPEAWYHAAGGVCLETPEGKGYGHAGDKGFIVPADLPMQLTVVGTEQRRSIVLILHETGKPATALDTGWVPKGLCRE